MKPLLWAVAPTAASLLLLLTVVAALPVLLAGSPEPQPLRQPQGGAKTALVLVRSGSGQWYADGTAVDAATLRRRLQARAGRFQISFLPSPALAAGEVTASLAWLRQVSASPVQLELAAVR